MTQPRSGDDSPVDGDRILWEGSSTARWPAVLAGLMALWALVIVVWLPPAWPGSLSLLLSTMIVLPLGRIDVRVAGAGVEVSYGRSGLIRQRVRRERIDSTAIVCLSAWSGGGLGYKGSLRLLGWARAANRGGPGLRLRLDDRRSYTVSVDDPQGAVDALTVLGVPQRANDE